MLTDSKSNPSEEKKKDVPQANLIAPHSLGIWTVLIGKRPGNTLHFNLWKTVTTTVRSLSRVMRDVYHLAPGLLIVYTLVYIWGCINDTVLLYFSGRLLRILEIGLREGNVDHHVVLNAFATRILVQAFDSLVQWQGDRTRPALRDSVLFFYREYLLRLKLRTDLPTASDASCQIKAQPYHGWDGFDTALRNGATVVSVFTQVIFMLRSATGAHGFLFPLLCIAQPMLRMITSQLWDLSHVVFSTNEDYKRTEALWDMTDEGFRREIIGGGLGDHLSAEYTKARNRLRGVCSDDAYDQWEQRKTPWFSILTATAGDLPMLYFVVAAILDPTKILLSDIAIQQQTSVTLQNSFASLIWESRYFARCMTNLRELFQAQAISNKIVDGAISVPCPSLPMGLSFELKNVIFDYPGSKTETKALNGVTLSIRPGQLVIVVGSNGSGKSTLINLLTRLYDATSGEILIDSEPISKYSMASLRQATALLSQDHHLFPLSFYENIALGCPEHKDDRVLVEDSIKKGGASFVEKYKEGLDTVLVPVKTAYGVHVRDEEDPAQVALMARLKELEQSADVSGGERQKVVAARTFMRFQSGKIRFVAVDEPSSALDADAELHLFNNLIECREGKTMVFVTHRFGHLTTHADVILFMKDGKIAEQGTHSELLKLDGGYAELYRIQAAAFTSSD